MSQERALDLIQESLNGLLARGALDRELDVRQIAPGSTLDDIGLDSVTTAMLLQEVEDNAGILLPEEELASMGTFAEFVTLVANTLDQPAN